MNELSLFTGAGGGLLGTHLLGWRPVGYVEWNEYCQRVIAARIRDGILPAAPIFTDVREFAQSGAAYQYRGIADVVTAGFPCQPFTVAGKQLAEGDERNMWPATADVIRRVRPKRVQLENVPGLLTCGYAGIVLADLAAMGYVGRYGCISGANTGAHHERLRWWVVAHAIGEGCADIAGRREVGELARHSSAGMGNGATGIFRQWPVDPTENQIAPRMGRVASGIPNGMDRLRALGNAQIPRVAATAWHLLSR
ncbi:MAG: DNA cytosine methyltransferase [Ralstonia sp.]|nr:MAG: DNA cytosine methyltransferase [Ralstonia sp.]